MKCLSRCILITVTEGMVLRYLMVVVVLMEACSLRRLVVRGLGWGRVVARRVVGALVWGVRSPVTNGWRRRVLWRFVSPSGSAGGNLVNRAILHLTLAARVLDQRACWLIVTCNQKQIHICRWWGRRGEGDNQLCFAGSTTK